MNATLAGKTIFISGGSRGIGLAIAMRAARDGANVAIAAKTADPHPSLPGTIYTAARQIEEAGGHALPLVCDIREEEQVEAAVTATVARFGGIDICLNNASAVRLTGILDTPVKRYDLINGVNTRGTFLVTQNACRICLSPRTRIFLRFHRRSTWRSAGSRRTLPIQLPNSA